MAVDVPVGRVTPLCILQAHALTEDVVGLIDDRDAARSGHDAQPIEDAIPRDAHPVRRQDHQRGAVALRTRLEPIQGEGGELQGVLEGGWQSLLGERPVDASGRRLPSAEPLATCPPAQGGQTLAGFDLRGEQGIPFGGQPLRQPGRAEHSGHDGGRR